MPESFSNYTDDELLAFIKAGQVNDAFSELYSRYAHTLYCICQSYFHDPELSREMVMQIVEKLLTELPRWEIKQPKAWISKLAQNHCLMYLRQQKRKPIYHPEFLEEIMESEDDFHLVLEKEARLQQVENALNDIPKEQEQCLRWFYLEKKSYNEIMNLSGFTFMQVKSFIQNGKRNLKNRIEAINRHE